ncbi:MAG: HipA domain-containing protein [Spirochaetaceae bacterium]|nr:HipA domain-containing protein [Spirochaetaceae bacterium]
MTRKARLWNAHAARGAHAAAGGRRVIERNSGITELGEFDYLVQGPDDRAGAQGFGHTVEPPAARRRFNRTLDLAALQRAADAVLDDDREAAGAAADRVEELLLLGTSMGGARPKVVVEHEGGLWLAKFGRTDDRWNESRVEHATLALARACGLNVADSRIEAVAGRDVLLVRRFDRERTDDGPTAAGHRRHRMVSALTLLRTGDGLADRGDWSYLTLADEVRRASARPEHDLRELFGRICFNAAVSNLDDHPRNHALLAKGRQWRLSPAYDLTPSPVVARERRDLAMACGRFGRYANRANLLTGHGRFLLDRSAAAALFDGIASTVRARWHTEMRRAGVSARDCEAIRSAFLYDGLFYEHMAEP